MKRFICLIMICMMMCGLFTACGQEKHQLAITGPSGVVYPYHDCVKFYLEAKNPNMQAYAVEGTNEKGDSSIKPVTISWMDDADTNVTKYVVEYGLKEDFSDAISVEKDSTLDKKNVDVLNLYKASTYYVRVTAYAGEEMLDQVSSTFQTTDLGPRIIKIDGIHNVRDMGGYVTVDGKTTVQGLVYRGGEMDLVDGSVLLTEAGAAYMSDVLGIQTDLDLRGYPAKTPIPYAQKANVAINAYESAFTETELYRQIFYLLADEDNYPVYIHCAGGADRTGTVCYLLGALVGMTEEDLIRDYEFTSFSVYGLRSKYSESYKYPEFVARLKTYDGDTLQEKTENYMLSIGVTPEEIENIRAIMLGEY